MPISKYPTMFAKLKGIRDWLAMISFSPLLTNEERIELYRMRKRVHELRLELANRANQPIVEDY